MIHYFISTLVVALFFIVLFFVPHTLMSTRCLEEVDDVISKELYELNKRLSEISKKHDRLLDKLGYEEKTNVLVKKDK